MLDLDEEPDSISELILKLIVNDQEEDICTLTYTNGGAEFNDEQGYYMPTSYNEFSRGELDTFAKNIERTLEINFPNFREDIDIAHYIAVKDGGNYPTADFPCEECGENYVSIDDSILDIGKCANCGHEHEIETDRCETYFNSRWEGRSGLCESCIEYIDNQ